MNIWKTDDIKSLNIWDSVQGVLKTTISLQDIITGKGNPAVDVIITTISYIIHKHSLLRWNKGMAGTGQYEHYFAIRVANAYQYL